MRTELELSYALFKHQYEMTPAKRKSQLFNCMTPGILEHPALERDSTPWDCIEAEVLPCCLNGIYVLPGHPFVDYRGGSHSSHSRLTTCDLERTVLLCPLQASHDHPSTRAAAPQPPSFPTPLCSFASRPVQSPSSPDRRDRAERGRDLR